MLSQAKNVAHILYFQVVYQVYADVHGGFMADGLELQWGHQKCNF